jgi:hypothetical protein
MPYCVWPSAATRSKPASGGAIVQPGCGAIVASGLVGALAISGQAPALGFNALTGQIDGQGTSPITRAISVSASSVGIIVVGGVSLNLTTTPFDGTNSYAQIGSLLEYTAYPGFGIKVFADTSLAGGSFTVSKSKPNNAAYEETLVFIEVKDADTIVSSITESSSGSTAVSGSVTVPAGKTATLIGLHWGDEGSLGSRNATPATAGFTKILSYELSDTPHVQVAVAAKDNVGPGTYTLTWNNSPSPQRALVPLFAVYKAG